MMNAHGLRDAQIHINVVSEQSVTFRSKQRGQSMLVLKRAHNGVNATCTTVARSGDRRREMHYTSVFLSDAAP